MKRQTPAQLPADTLHKRIKLASHKDNVTSVTIQFHRGRVAIPTPSFSTLHAPAVASDPLLTLELPHARFLTLFGVTAESALTSSTHIEKKYCAALAALAGTAPDQPGTLPPVPNTNLTLSLSLLDDPPAPGADNAAAVVLALLNGQDIMPQLHEIDPRTRLDALLLADSMLFNLHRSTYASAHMMDTG